AREAKGFHARRNEVRGAMGVLGAAEQRLAAARRQRKPARVGLVAHDLVEVAHPVAGYCWPGLVRGQRHAQSCGGAGLARLELEQPVLGAILAPTAGGTSQET